MLLKLNFNRTTQVFDKLIGVTLGLYAGGPAGAVVGLAVGHAAGLGMRRVRRLRSSRRIAWPAEPAPQAFYAACFYALGALSKRGGFDAADFAGYTEAVMEQLGLQPPQRSRAQHFLTAARRSNFPLDAALLEFREAAASRSAWAPAIMEILVHGAYLNGLPDKATVRWLSQVATRIGCSPADLWWARKREEAKIRRGHRRVRRSPAGVEQGVLAESYTVLGVAQWANDDDVTRAYRRLLSRFHPDKLIAQGATPAAVEAATEETKRIKRAYEIVREARNA